MSGCFGFGAGLTGAGGGNTGGGGLTTGGGGALTGGGFTSAGGGSLFTSTGFGAGVRAVAERCRNQGFPTEGR